MAIIYYPRGSVSSSIPPPTLSTLGGVFANPGNAHQWISAINTDGSVTTSQPSFSDISGTITPSQIPTGLTPYNVMSYGATGNGVTNDYAAIVATVNAAAATNGTVYFPGGIYLVDSTIVVPYNVNLLLDFSATVRAGAALTYLVETDGTNFPQNQWIYGGIFDCNNQATNGIFLRQYRHFVVQNVNVINCSGTAYWIGDNSLGGGFEAFLINVRAFNSAAFTVGSGSIGILISSGVSDNRVQQAVLVGFQTGVSAQSGGNRFYDIHPWAYAASGSLLTAFDDNGNGNVWEQCFADTPNTYGWHLRQSGAMLVNCGVYVGQFGNAVDDTVIGVHCEETQPFFQILNMSFIGEASNLRLANDIDGITNWSGSLFLGQNESNVVTQTTPSVHGIDLRGSTVPDFLSFSSGAVIDGSPTMNSGALIFGNNGLNTAEFLMVPSSAVFQMNMAVANGTSFGNFSLFSTTNTTGGVGLNIFSGDGSSNVNHFLAGGSGGGNSYLCKFNGELTVGQSGNTGVGLLVNGFINTTEGYQVNGTPISYASTWNTIGNATAALTLANAAFATTFDQTSAVAWTWANTTAATSSVPQSSPSHVFSGTYWTGSVSATDSFTIQAVPGSGTNPLSVFSIAHSGSSGGGQFNWNSSAVTFSNGGSITSAGNIFAGASNSLGWSGHSLMQSSASGTITLAPSTGVGNAFTTLQFGGQTSSFPAFGFSGTTIIAQLADASAQAPFEAATLLLTAVAPTASAGQVAFGSTTSASATGGAATLPANPLGFLVANVAGTSVKIPYYSA